MTWRQEPGSGPTMLDLVRNGTMDPATAATLSAVAEGKRSFMVVALPRMAGKSTVTNAMLDFAPAGVPIHHLSGEENEMERLAMRPDGGYLVVAELSPYPIPTYIWGPPVRKVFEVSRAGFSLCFSLHASGVEEAYDEVCSGNGISDDDASRINYVVYIERMGTHLGNFRRRVSAVYEVEKVLDGAPQSRIIHRWDPRSDSFEIVATPRLLGLSRSGLQDRASLIRESSAEGRGKGEHDRLKEMLRSIA